MGGAAPRRARKHAAEHAAVGSGRARGRAVCNSHGRMRHDGAAVGTPRSPLGAIDEAGAHPLGESESSAWQRSALHCGSASMRGEQCMYQYHRARAKADTELSRSAAPCRATSHVRYVRARARAHSKLALAFDYYETTLGTRICMPTAVQAVCLYVGYSCLSCCTAQLYQAAASR